jgi:glycosyltransferase involved in cell wall biosynthesis
MRVIHVADYGGPYAGSFVPMLRAVGAAVRSRGGDFEVAFTRVAQDRPWLDELAADGVRVSFAPPGRDRKECARFLGDLTGAGSEPAIIHTHFTAFDLPAVSVAKDRPGMQVFWHVHTPLRSERTIRLRNAVKFAFAGRRVDKILCVAPGIAAAVQARHAPRERVVVLPNAIDLERFPPRNRARTAEGRRRLGLRAGDRVLLHFGWDWERKGGDLFVAAVRRLREREPVRAVVVGGGAPARAAGDREGLDEDTLRVIDPVEDITSLYAAADVFVATSEAEGMPYSMAEALACGLPVVATDIPGHDYLAHIAGNVRLTLRDSDEVAAAISRTLATDEDLARQTGARARERVARAMDLTSWSERLVGLYERALEAPGRLS